MRARNASAATILLTYSDAGRAQAVPVSGDRLMRAASVRDILHMNAPRASSNQPSGQGQRRPLRRHAMPYQQRQTSIMGRRPGLEATAGYTTAETRTHTEGHLVTRTREYSGVRVERSTSFGRRCCRGLLYSKRPWHVSDETSTENPVQRLVERPSDLLCPSFPFESTLRAPTRHPCKQ
jgi:hypothetical protein